MKQEVAIMEEFRPSHLCEWRAAGFHFINCYNQWDYYLIEPTSEIMLELDKRHYQISIKDEQCREMANGIDEFPIYIKPQ